MSGFVNSMRALKKVSNFFDITWKKKRTPIYQIGVKQWLVGLP